MRLSPDIFRELVERVGPVIQKEKSRIHEPFPAGLKVAIILRYLATGVSDNTLMYGFWVAFNTISLFVPDMCETINQIYKNEQQLKSPSTPQQWRGKALQRWNFSFFCQYGPYSNHRSKFLQKATTNIMA